jgi:hypothetical protein
MYPVWSHIPLHSHELQNGSEGIWNTVNNVANWIHLTATLKAESMCEHNTNNNELHLENWLKN